MLGRPLARTPTPRDSRVCRRPLAGKSVECAARASSLDAGRQSAGHADAASRNVSSKQKSSSTSSPLLRWNGSINSRARRCWTPAAPASALARHRSTRPPQWTNLESAWAIHRCLTCTWARPPRRRRQAAEPALTSPSNRCHRPYGGAHPWSPMRSSRITRSGCASTVGECAQWDCCRPDLQLGPRLSVRAWRGPASWRRAS